MRIRYWTFVAFIFSLIVLAGLIGQHRRLHAQGTDCDTALTEARNQAEKDFVACEDSVWRGIYNWLSGGSKTCRGDYLNAMTQANKDFYDCRGLNYGQR